MRKVLVTYTDIIGVEDSVEIQDFPRPAEPDTVFLGRVKNTVKKVLDNGEDTVGSTVTNAKFI